MSGIRFERAAGLAGLAFFALIVATFITPSTPDIGVADTEIGPAVAADWKGLAGGQYLLGAAVATFAVFASGLWSRLRRAEGDTAGASVVALVGAVIFGTLVLVSSGVTLALVAASREERDPTAIRALFELDDVIFLMSGFAFALFLLGTAASVLSTGVLPAWLGWVAGVLGLGFFVGLLGLLSAGEEGGPLGNVYFAVLMASVLWVLLTSISLIRTPLADAPPWRRPTTRAA